VSADDEVAARLIESAWDVLERTGFDGFKVASLIRACGISTKTFYKHFESKDQVFLALLLDEMDRAGARLERTVSRRPNPPAAASAWIDGVMAAAHHPSLRPRARLFASLSTLNERYPERVRDGRAGLMQPLVRVLQEREPPGRARATEDAVATYFLCSSALGAVLDGTAGTTPGLVVEQVKRYALRSLGYGDVRPSPAR
jgi:AcrR family transcriptional regulator